MPSAFARFILLAAALTLAGCSSPGTSGAGGFSPVGPDVGADVTVSDTPLVDLGTVDLEPDVPEVACTTDEQCATELEVGPCLTAFCDTATNLCAASPVRDGIACDDESLCTTDTACLSGACIGTPKVDCADGNTCTLDGCNPATGSCVFEVETGALCDDATPCTSDDACQSSGECRGLPMVCDDLNPCTVDACEAATGVCQNVADPGGPCDDGDACTTGDGCDAAAVCVGVVTDCSDANDCTSDTCDAATGGCANAPIVGLACDDGQACTSGDQCLANGSCEGAATDCDDGDGCTTDSCNAATGACSNVPVVGLGCNDGDGCTSSDACQANGTCQGSPVPTDDGNPCTIDACSGGVITNTPDLGAPCSDGDACSTGDACNGAGGCAGTAMDCDDNDACTTDTCSFGFCTNPAIDCDDGNPCTIDGCSPVAGCTATPLPCNDGDPCTTDSCDPLAGGCVAAPIGGCGGAMPYFTDFKCSEGGWTTVIVEGAVPFAVDALPAAPGFWSSDCSLNFNDDISGYDSPTGASLAHATSPPIDTSGAPSVWLGFVQYWQTAEGPTGSYDQRGVQVSDDGFATWTDYPSGHVAGVNASQWFYESIDLSAFAGATIEVRFWFDSVDGAANTGVGWFIDDLTVSVSPPSVGAEDCGNGVDDDLDLDVDCSDANCIGDAACSESLYCQDGVDNDGDGQTDCADPECFAVGVCIESLNCLDGVDNDLDGLTDCADPNCSAEFSCIESLNCLDGVDNDVDGLADCLDPACLFLPMCCTVDGMCDDSNACTADTCALGDGTCQYAAVSCTDADTCTADTCNPAVGCEFPVLAGCPAALPHTDDFPCSSLSWTSEVLEGEVTWAVDALPNPPAYYSTDCSLNFNDDVSSYDSASGPSNGHATSIPVDATGATSLWLGFMQYWQTAEGPTGTYDQRGVQVSDDGFATWTDYDPGHVAAANDNQWFYRTIDLSAHVGTQIQVRYWFDSVDGAANTGVGWFVDDLTVSESVPSIGTEICDNGTDDDFDLIADCADDNCIGDPACPEDAFCQDARDNDGDGLTDCADPQCAANPACIELGNCADGVDNDLDGLVDCADPGCAAESICLEQDNCFDGIDNDLDGLADCLDPDCLLEPTCCAAAGDCDDADACTTDSCTVATGSCVNTAIACIDGDLCTADSCDPASGCVYPPLVGCPFTLPHVDDMPCGSGAWTAVIVEGGVPWAVDALPNPPGFWSTDCSLNFNDDVGSYDSLSGPSNAHVTSAPIDATAAATVWIGFAQYWDTAEGPTGTYDQRGVQVSDDGFATWTDYSPGHIAGTNDDAWFYETIDVSAFAGTQLQVRFWFDSVDGAANTGAGWFVDDLTVSTTQPPTPPGL